MFRILLPLVPHERPLKDEDFRLKMPVIKGRCARDTLSHTFNIGVLKCGNNFYCNKTYLQPIW